jgi:membrane-associated protein
LLDFFLHLDVHLKELMGNYQAWTYAILFLVVFCETGLVIAPFLPGDSLLFACGIFSQPTPGQFSFNPWLIGVTLASAAILGDSTNYFIGRFLGPRMFHNPKSRIFKRENLEKTHEFFERYGAKTVIFARFVPIIRTFAPFVAGIGTMPYPRFLLYSVAGSLLWVGVCVTAGYFFGSIPAVRSNFSIAMASVILITVIPAVIEILRQRRKRGRKAA